MIMEDKIKDAIEVCEKNHISAEQFGQIVKYVDEDTQTIYSILCLR